MGLEVIDSSGVAQRMMAEMWGMTIPLWADYDPALLVWAVLRPMEDVVCVQQCVGFYGSVHVLKTAQL